MIDHALKAANFDGQTQCEWLFASDVGGAVETVRGTGSHLREWNQAFSTNLRGCGDMDTAPRDAEERWVRAHKYLNSPLPEAGTSRDQIERFRCPRCLTGNPSCSAVFALPSGSVIHYPDPARASSTREQIHEIVIHGELEEIWIYSSEEIPLPPRSKPKSNKGNALQSEGIKRTLEYNEPRIEALPANTTGEKEVVKFFKDYLAASFHSDREQYFRDSSFVHMKGSWAPSGVITATGD